MSELQSKVKPILVPLIEGRFDRLSSTDQQTLSLWSMMFVSVAEMRTPDKAIIPQTERDGLREKVRVPKNWKIYVGRYARERWIANYIHHLIPIYDANEEELFSTKPRSNTQTTVFVVGHAYVYAISSSNKRLVQRWNPDRDGEYLKQIWPPAPAPTGWPFKTLDDIIADRLAVALWRKCQRVVPLMD